MKRTNSDRDKSKRRAIQWDEGNLEENEKIKKELQPSKISEPKTPYHGPMDTDDELHFDEEAAMEPLTLDEEGESSKDNRSPEISAERKYSGGEGRRTTSDTPDVESRPPTTHDAESHPPGDEEAEGSGPGGEDHHVSDQKSGEGRDGREGLDLKRRRFVENRKKHYKMKEAIQLGKALLSEDEEFLHTNNSAAP